MGVNPPSWEEITEPGFTAIVFAGVQELDPQNDNVDVEVKLPGGSRYSATFFTPANIVAIMERYRATGECRDGLYFWTIDMIIVERLTLSTIRETIEALLEEGQLSTAFLELKDELDFGEEDFEV